MEQSQQQYFSGGKINYKRYLRTALKYWYIFPFSIVLALTINYVFNKISKKQYAVNCQIVFGNDISVKEDPKNYYGGYNFNQSNPIKKEIGIIRSKQLAKQTLEQLNFNVSYYLLIKGKWIRRARYGNIPFKIIVDNGTINPTETDLFLKILSPDSVEIVIEELKNKIYYVKFGDSFNKHGYHFKLEKNQYQEINDYINNQYVFVFNDKNILIDKFIKNLIITEHPNSQEILTLRLKGESPERLVLYLNTLCGNYIENDRNVRNQMADNTIKYIDSQLEILTNKLKEAENNLILYRKKENIYKSEIGDQYIDELMNVQNKIRETEMGIESLRNVNNLVNSLVREGEGIIPTVLFENNSEVNSDIKKINELIITKQYLLKNQKSNSPEVLKINQQIEIQLSILKSITDKNIVNLEKQKKNLENKAKDLEAMMVNMPASERQLNKLQRNSELAQNILNLYQQKRIEAVLAKASTVSNIRVLDPATFETLELVKPKKSQNRKIAIILGLLIPVLLIIIKEQISNAITDLKEISYHTDIPIVGKVFHNREKTYLVADKFPSSAVAESLRSTLARIRLTENGIKKQVLSLTSGSSGDGKTFIALNLATLLAQSGKKTLLIGLDLRRSQLHYIFEKTNSTGLSTYLSGVHHQNDVIFETHIKNLYFVPAGPIPPNPVELIQDERLETFIIEARKKFNHIIIDTPPIGIVADAMLVNKHTDINMFIIRLGQTRKTIYDLTEELKRNDSLKNIHLIINDIREPERYGYYSQSKYSRYYATDGKYNFIEKFKVKKN